MLKFHKGSIIGTILFLLVTFNLVGCTIMPRYLTINSTGNTYTAETILDTETGSSIELAGMLANLSQVDVIYVGEQHNDVRHHQIQLQILKAIWEKDRRVAVGMEMFSREYQPVLDSWSAGELEESEFLKKSQWYANWRFPFRYYREILSFVRDNNIRLVALNLPGHIPARIATGGIDNLLPSDRRHLPADIDMSNKAHRDYLRKIFESHHLPGRSDFESFYQAQCVWEDKMAESIAENISSDRMVVLVGNGHIIKKFGVPNRAFRRTGKSFKTVYPANTGTETELNTADYIWVTSAKQRVPSQ